MIDTNPHVRENRLRRAVERRGLILVKIARFDKTALGNGQFAILDPATDLLTLEQAEAKLGDAFIR